LIAAGIGAGLLLVVGAICFLLYLAWPLLESGERGPAIISPDEAISQAAQFAILAFYGLVLGGALLRQVIRGSRGAPSARFQPASVAGVLAVVGFPVALLAGIVALQLPHRVAGYLFPLAALLAVLTPPVLVLNLVGRAGWRRAGEQAPAPVLSRPGGLPGRTSREDPFAADLVRRVVGPPTWRRILGALAWGMGGATAISLVLEVVGAIAALLLVVGFALAGGPGQLTQWQNLLTGDAAAAGCDTLRSVFGNPFVVGGLVLAVGVFVPLIEEPAKSLGVLWLRGRLSAPRDALLYGAVAGIGFGMIESAVYNVGDLNTWWGTATLRLGTTFVHALATGLFGVAWYYRLQHRDRGRFRRYALASVGVHGLWNASTVGIIAVGATRSCAADPVGLVMTGDPFGYAAIIWLILLTVGAAVLLMLLARRLGPPELLAGAARSTA
jgi:RsiW-degrading membrane proteinase PrsW (M82 family)